MTADIKILAKTDSDEFLELIKLFKIVFEMEDLIIPDKKYLEKLLAKEGFFVFAAKNNDTVIGGLTVYTLEQYYSEKPLAYIYDVGVLPEYQRMGIGKKLIAALKAYCIENGFDAAYVEAESDDQQAVDFYRKTAFSSILQATHFTYSFNADNE